MPGFKYLVLGFDDTFVNLRRGYSEVFSSVFKQFDIPFDEGAVLEYADTPLDKLFSERYKGCTCRFRDFMTMTMAAYERHVFDSAELYGDAGVLRDLVADGCVLGITSTSFEEHVRRHLKRFDMEGMFASVVGQERVFVPRPDPFGLETCLREMGAVKSETIVVTSSPVDVTTTGNAGVRAVLLDRDGTRCGVPDVPVISGLEALKDF